MATKSNLVPAGLLLPKAVRRTWQSSSSMSRIIGIDLGTTNSLGGYVTEEGPVIIPNALGEPLTPSVVGMDKDGKLLVGRAAKELQVTQPERCAGLFKRAMGRSEEHTSELQSLAYLVCRLLLEKKK